MRHNIHSNTPLGNAIAAGASETPFYAEDLLPALQSTLAALADLELCYEIARDSLEDLCTSEEAKQRHRAELEQVHRQACEPYLQQLARIQAHDAAARPHH